jgi:hypothetical protein
MRFYYISIISVILLFVIWFVGTGLLTWLGSSLRKSRKRVWPVMLPLFLLLYLAPIAEELWIAWNFGQLCKKDAGIFITQTVEVDGFFNESGAGLDLVRPGNYKYIEAPNEDGAGAKRLEFGNAQWAKAAIERFEDQNPEKSVDDRKYIRVDMDEKTQALVFLSNGDSWRMTKLDHPTARYHYKTLATHLRVSHQIKKFEDAVVDQQTGDALGRYLNYYRGAPWFFVGLDRPTISCRETRDATRKYGRLIYRSVLMPPK